MINYKGETIASSGPDFAAFGTFALADLEGDGLFEIMTSHEIVVGYNLLIYLSCYNHDLTLRWGKNISTHGGSWGSWGNPVVSDLDGDGIFEIIAAEAHRIHTYQQDGIFKWKLPHSRFNRLGYLLEFGTF